MWTVKNVGTSFTFCSYNQNLDTVLSQDRVETSEQTSVFIKKESTRKQPGAAILIKAHYH